MRRRSRPGPPMKKRKEHGSRKASFDEVVALRRMIGGGFHKGTHRRSPTGVVRQSSGESVFLCMCRRCRPHLICRRRCRRQRCTGSAEREIGGSQVLNLAFQSTPLQVQHQLRHRSAWRKSWRLALRRGRGLRTFRATRDVEDLRVRLKLVF